MNSSQKGGKSKSSQSSKSSKSKKGGNFLGAVSELFVPTGWENFATAAGLLALDRADAAFRRGKNSSKKQKGGADLDGHESLESMDSMLDTIYSEDASSPDTMSGGAKKKSKSKTAKKPATKKSAKTTTKSKTAKKPSTKKAKKPKKSAK